MRTRVWLSLGSNIEPEKNIRSAVAALRQNFGELIVSPVYESEAVGFEGDSFLNLVVGLETERTARDLAERVRQIEHEHGRVRDGGKMSSRTLDIDLLTYGDQVVREPGIDLPRDEIKQYAFVLLPLSQVAAEELHPVEGVSYRELWERFDHSQQSMRVLDLDLG